MQTTYVEEPRDCIVTIAKSVTTTVKETREEISGDLIERVTVTGIDGLTGGELATTVQTTIDEGVSIDL
jgi:hypothetical protein